MANILNSDLFNAFWDTAYAPNVEEYSTVTNITDVPAAKPKPKPEKATYPVWMVYTHGSYNVVVGGHDYTADTLDNAIFGAVSRFEKDGFGPCNGPAGYNLPYNAHFANGKLTHFTCSTTGMEYKESYGKLCPVISNSRIGAASKPIDPHRYLGNRKIENTGGCYHVEPLPGEYLPTLLEKALATAKEVNTFVVVKFLGINITLSHTDDYAVDEVVKAHEAALDRTTMPKGWYYQDFGKREIYRVTPRPKRVCAGKCGRDLDDPYVSVADTGLLMCYECLDAATSNQQPLDTRIAEAKTKQAARNELDSVDPYSSDYDFNPWRDV